MLHNALYTQVWNVNSVTQVDVGNRRTVQQQRFVSNSAINTSHCGPLLWPVHLHRVIPCRSTSAHRTSCVSAILCMFTVNRWARGVVPSEHFQASWSCFPLKGRNRDGTDKTKMQLLKVTHNTRLSLLFSFLFLMGQVYGPDTLCVFIGRLVRCILKQW